MRFSHYLHQLISVIVLILLIPTIRVSGNILNQGNTDSQVKDLLDRMTPEERVGQLFLVTFKGTDAGVDTQIHELVNNHFVGGVILLAENDNFTDSYNNLIELWTLINQLQVSRYSTSQNNRETTDQVTLPPPIYVPLFIGTHHEGDGYPNDQILTGLTPLPRQDYLLS